jgi:AraC-like DNA-binding protein
MSPPSPALLTHPQGSLRTYLGGHAPHAHSHAQVLLGVEGGLALEVDGRSAWVDATAGLVIPAGATHGFESRAGARVWVVDAPACLGLDRLRAFALPPGWTANPGCGSSPGQGTATDAGTGTGTASSTYGQTGTSLSAAQVLDTLDQAARVQVRRPVEVARLQAAVADTLHQPWPVQRMAALYCLSVPRFQVRWQALTGLSPQAWLRDQRLDAAQRQLKAGWPLETVALQVGYRSASALLFALRRDRGQTTRNLRGS